MARVALCDLLLLRRLAHVRKESVGGNLGSLSSGDIGVRLEVGQVERWNTRLAGTPTWISDHNASGGKLRCLAEEYRPRGYILEYLLCHVVAISCGVGDYFG